MNNELTELLLEMKVSINELTERVIKIEKIVEEKNCKTHDINVHFDNSDLDADEFSKELLKQLKLNCNN